MAISLFSYTVAAGSGCFLYKDSPFYCFTIDAAKAQEECAANPDCQFESSWASLQSCLDLPDCQTIMCKSSCQLELQGNCPAGEVPSGEEQQWCSSGCCVFNFGEQNYCDYSLNQWYCQNKAENKNSAEYKFDTRLSQEDCNQLCLKSVEERKLFASGISTSTKQNQSSAVSGSSGGSSGFIFLIFLIVISISVVIYYFFLRERTGKKNFSEEEETAEERPLPSWLSPLNSNPFVRKRIEKSKQERFKKVKKQEQEELLISAGLPPPPATYFGKLELINKLHQKKRTEKKNIKRLQRLIKEGKIVPKQESTKKEENEEIFRKLKLISGK